jgi:hypothetical protein
MRTGSREDEPSLSCGTKLTGAPGAGFGTGSPASGSERGFSGSVGVIKRIVEALRL